MGTKVKKGLLKPIRYISQIFDNKEPEMQIGFPTEVKHVAHIGWDGPNNVNSNPSWMNDYHSAPLNSCAGTDGRESSTTNSWGSQEFSVGGGLEDSPARQSRGGTEDSAHAPSKPRHSRRHQSSESLSNDSTNGDALSVDGSTKKSRKPRKKDAAGGAGGSAGSSQDLPAIPKQSHRRKSKDSSGGSVRSKTRASTSKLDAAGEENSIKPSTAAAHRAVEEDYE